MQAPGKSVRVLLKYALALLLIYYAITILAGGLIRSALQEPFAINAFYAGVLAFLIDVAFALYYRLEHKQRPERARLYKIAADALIMPAMLLTRALADTFGGEGGVSALFEIVHLCTAGAALLMFLTSAGMLLKWMWKR